MHARGRVAALTLGFVLAGAASTALAHGPFPRTRRVTFHPTDPSTLLVEATYGVFVTRDAGETWDWMCFEAMGFEQENVLIANPVSTLMADESIVVATRRGLVRSEDGCGFSAPSEALAADFLVDLERDPSDPSAALVLVANANAENGVFASNDDGASWDALGDPIAKTLFESMAVAPSDPARIYLTSTDPISATNLTYQTQVFRTADRGVTWQGAPLASPDEDAWVTVLAVNPTDADTVLLADRFRFDGKVRRLLRTTDGGETWTELSAMNGKRITGAVWSDDGATLFVGGSAGAGLWASGDDGDSFDSVNEDIDVGCLAFHNEALWACANEFTDGFSVGRSVDGGESFEKVFEHDRIRGLLECAETSDLERLCRPQILDLIFDLGLSIDPGVDYPDASQGDGGEDRDAGEPKTRSSGGGCAVAPRRQGSGTTLAGFGLFCLGLVGSGALRRTRARRPRHATESRTFQRIFRARG